jgi:hypothetical protein
MLLDQSSNQLLRTNFLGRDGFIWWVGQIALKETSKWDESDLPSKEESKELYYNRVKVRIFGYHTGNCEDLPDVQLPWAHILIPPGESNGVGKQGRAHNYQGGETVIGFFLDGDDAQQPVIFGSLYKSAEIKSITPDEVASKLCSQFKPVEPSQPRAHNSLSPKDAGGQNVVTGVGDVNSTGTPSEGNKSGIDNVSSIAEETTSSGITLFSTKLNNKITKPSLCDNNGLNNTINAIDSLLKKVENYQNIANTFYYDKIRNRISDFSGEVRKVATILTGDISGYIKKGMNFLFEKISQILGVTFGGLFPKTKQSLIGQQIDKILEAIYCIFKKIGFDLFDIIDDALNNFIGTALGATICVIENFLGQLLSKILSTIEDAILPLLDSLNALLNGALGSVTGLLSSAMNLLGLIQGLLSCVDPTKFCDTPQTFSIVSGIDIGSIGNIEDIIASVGDVGSIIRDFPLSATINFSSEPKTGTGAATAIGIGTIGGVVGVITDIQLTPSSFKSTGPIDLSKNECDPSTRTCGPPRVVFTGGGGSGARGNAVVNNRGEVIGVVVTNPGCGYIEPPVVSFIDDCDNGQFARGRATIGKVNGCLRNNGVTGVIMDDPGEKYLNKKRKQKRGKPKDEFIPDDDILIEDNPDAGIGTTGGRSYIGIITDVNIKKQGYGYDKNTKVKVGDCEADVVIGPGGIIQKVKIKGSCYNDTIPLVTINSFNGAAAELIPVLQFVPVYGGNVGISTIVSNKVIKVIDCV